MNITLVNVIRRSPSLARSWLSTAAAVPLTQPVSPAAAATELQNRLQPEGVKVSRLSNGITVASLEHYDVTSKVGVFIRAGSRYESYSHRGVTHLLQHCALASTRSRAAIGVTRELEELGSSIKAYHNREQMIYVVDSLRGNVQPIMEIISSIVCEPAFYRWEIPGYKDRLQFDLDTMSPVAAVTEGVHYYGFRHGLSNSIYCPPHNVNVIGEDQLNAFTGENYVANKTVVVGLGVNHSELLDITERSMFGTMPEATEVNHPIDEYVGGGEYRVTASTPMCHVMLGCKGVGLGNTVKEVMTASVLQYVLGVKDVVKYSSNLSRLSKAGQSIEAPFSATANNFNYADTGMFAITMVTHGDHMAKLMKVIVKEFSEVAKGNINDAELVKAKNQFKAQLMMCNEGRHSLFEDIGTQVGLHGSYTVAEDVMSVVDTVNKQDVIKFAQVVLNTKATMAAYGNLSNTPRLDKILTELK